MTEEEYANAAAGGPLPDFPYAYAEEVGLPMLEIAGHVAARGALLVRIAAHGQPERGPALFQKLAQVAEKNGDAAEAHKAIAGAVREFGQAVGAGQPAADQKAIYFAIVKKLGEEAAAAKDWKEAIHNYSSSPTPNRPARRRCGPWPRCTRTTARCWPPCGRPRTP